MGHADISAEPRPRDGVVRALAVLVAVMGLVITVLAAVAGVLGRADPNGIVPGGLLGISLLVFGLETVKHPRDRRPSAVSQILARWRVNPPGSSWTS